MLIDIGSCRLNVIEQGDGDPVLFLHSNTYSWRLWQHQLDELSTGFRCLAVDLRGYGQSDRIAPLTLTQYAADVEALCSTLNLGRVALVGMSLGGVVAQLVAIRNPTRVHKLVLANTTSGSDPAIADRVRASAETVRTQGLAPLLDGGFEATFSASFREAHPAVVRQVRREFESSDPLTIAATAESLAGHDHEAELSAITACTLVVHGQQDAMMASTVSDNLVRLIPDAHLHTIDAGHLSNLEAPAEFNEIVAGFLTSSHD